MKDRVTRCEPVKRKDAGVKPVKNKATEVEPISRREVLLGEEKNLQCRLPWRLCRIELENLLFVCGNSWKVYSCHLSTGVGILEACLACQVVGFEPTQEEGSKIWGREEYLQHVGVRRGRTFGLQ